MLVSPSVLAFVVVLVLNVVGVEDNREDEVMLVTGLLLCGDCVSVCVLSSTDGDKRRT